MNKKINILVVFAALCCVVVSAAAASSLASSGTLLYRDKGELDKTIEFQSEAGSYFSAHITAESFEDSAPKEESAADFIPEYTVNINTASEYELAALLPGIGEAKAAAIVEYRRITGGFNSVDELAEVSGISENLLEKIRPYCVIGED